MAILSKKEYIKNLLIKHPEFRDSDRELIAYIWLRQMKDVKELTFQYFIGAFLSGRIAMPDHITRARRKVQEQNENLRGTSWVDRKVKAVEVAQEMIADQE